MKIGLIDFPHPLLAALRDGNLVIFAGAGVSMGTPANLPSFQDLACQIAQNTGEQYKQGQEPVDRFLGRLKQKRGVKVHKRAAKVLSKVPGSAPTDLHRSLLRLGPVNCPIRIVTTNFDDLFERAAECVLSGIGMEIFRAPALPLGHEFNGLVHLHGAVSPPTSMVLTDEDFGRAYLTQGWARRFLVALFRHFTVLFIGYSHNDTILNYLARALLSENGAQKRFALVEEQDVKHWTMLGIHPVVYPNSGGQDFSALYEGVEKLAQYVRRGWMDWKHHITAVAQQEPPLGEDEAATMEEAMRDEVKTQFFVNAAASSEWIDWLERGQYLSTLFGLEHGSGPRDKLIAQWLAEKFALRHPEDLLLLLGRHDMSLSPVLWQALARTVGNTAQDEPSQDVYGKEAIARWVSVLLANVPTKIDRCLHLNALIMMARACIKHGQVSSLLQIYEVMARSNQIEIARDYSWSQERGVFYNGKLALDLEPIGTYQTLTELWEEGLEPNLAQVAEPLLCCIAQQLQGRHNTMRAWQQPDNIILIRPDIYDVSPERYPSALDALINAARDCLIWLVRHQPTKAAARCNQFVEAEVPLLRRLSVYALLERTDMATVDAQMDWLLTHDVLHDLSVQHEVFPAVCTIYPQTSSESRARFVAAVKEYRWPNEEDPNHGVHTARKRHDWLHRLHEVAPSCPIAQQALDELPDSSQMGQSQHPDRLFVVEPVRRIQSPWSVEELLAKSAADWLPELLTYCPQDLLEPSRKELMQGVAKAAQRELDWGFELANALACERHWDSDLWSGLLQAWTGLELDTDGQNQVFCWMVQTEPHAGHVHAIAEFLDAWTKKAMNPNQPGVLDLLPKACSIANALWQQLDRKCTADRPAFEWGGWLHLAKNRPAGILAQFWLQAFWLWGRQQDPVPAALNGEFRKALSAITADHSLAGRLGQSVLAGNLDHLLAVDAAWTQDCLLSLFEYDPSAPLGFQAVWDGFLTRGNLNSDVAEHMKGLFRKAMAEMKEEAARVHCQRFIAYYVRLLVFHIEDPLEQWIPPLFEADNLEMRHWFAIEVTCLLQGMQEGPQKEWWHRWLKHYWQNRLQGVPKALDPGEIALMYDWLPYMSSMFPEAVTIATAMPQTRLQDSQILCGLKRSSLGQTYPKEVIRLLLHLGERDIPEARWTTDGKALVDQLCQSSMLPELETELKTLKVRYNFQCSC